MTDDSTQVQINLKKDTIDHTPQTPPPKTSGKIVIVAAAILVVTCIIAIPIALKFGKKDKKVPISMKITDLIDTTIPTEIPSETPTTNVPDTQTDTLTPIVNYSSYIEKYVDKSDKIIVNITYNKGAIKIFEVEKLINSKSRVNETDEVQKTVQKHVCALGLQDNGDKDYFQGFFAILRSSIYNDTYDNYTVYRENSDLINIINRNGNYPLLRNLQEADEEEENEDAVAPFFKLEFFLNGTYRNIYAPENLSEINYKEMKTILDLVIPKISNRLYSNLYNDTDSLLNLNNTNTTLVDELKSFESLINETENSNNDIYGRRLSNNNGHRTKKRIRIKRKLQINETNLEDEESVKDSRIAVVDEETNETKYFEGSVFEDVEIQDDLQETASNNTAEIVDTGEGGQILNVNKQSELYSDYGKFRGSDSNTNISIVLENGEIKEIFSTMVINMKRQEYQEPGGEEVADTDSFFAKESEPVQKDIKASVTDTDTPINNTEGAPVIYNLDFSDSMEVTQDTRIVMNSSKIDENLIENIYDKYLNNFVYEEDNPTTRILRTLKEASPIEIIDIYEDDEQREKLRRLNIDLTGEKYYGLRKTGSTKDVFKSDILGQDIKATFTNEYEPSTGKSGVYFRLNVASLSKDIYLSSSESNQHIITENVQQMTYKLIRMIYESYQNLEKRNNDYINEISSKVKSVNQKILNTNIGVKYQTIDGYYSLIKDNTEKLTPKIIWLLFQLTQINSNFTVNINKADFKENEKLLYNNLSGYIDNITDEVQKKIEVINKTISEIDFSKINPNLYEAFNELIEQIKNFINYDLIKYLKSQIKNERQNYTLEIKEKIDKIINSNQLNIIQNIIDNNEIAQIIFSKDDFKSLSPLLKDIKNLIESNISYSHIKIFNNSLTRTNYSNIANITSELSNIKNIPNLNLNSIEQKGVDDYFKQKEDIDEAINDIIIKNIQQQAKLLNKSSHDSHELINNMTLDLESQMVNIAKSIKDYLMEILTTYQFRDAEKDILVSLLT